MKKTFAFLLFLLIFVGLAVGLRSQTRPRRVGQGSNPVPQTGSTPPTRPARPPVLGGQPTANKQPEAQTSEETNKGPEEVESGDVIRVDTTLVTLPVSVTDRDGKYIPNLTKTDFRLWENGVEQDVAFFSSVDKPFSVVLMLDTSGSTRFRVEDMQDAAIAFVNQLRSDDRVMVVSFDDQIRLLADFTGDRNRLRDAIRRTHTGEGTKLYDAMDLVINQELSRISGRKAIVLFTDGVDTTSRYSSYADNIRDAEELDALIYPVQYDTYSDMNNGGGNWPGSQRVPSPVEVLIGILGGMRRGGGMGGPIGGRGPGSNRADYALAGRYLRDLAERTGARHHQADTIRNLSYAFANIAEELRRQYSLGYYPKRTPQAGERRQVKVRVNQPNLAVRTRDSYIFAPGGGATQQAQRNPPVLRP